MSHAAKMSPWGAQQRHAFSYLKKKLSSELSEGTQLYARKSPSVFGGKPAVGKPVRPNTRPFTWAEASLTRSQGERSSEDNLAGRGERPADKKWGLGLPKLCPHRRSSREYAYLP